MVKSTSRIDKEKRIVEVMIHIYCRNKERNSVLCDNCRLLLVYALQRLDHCPFGDDKPSCKNCTIHCYKPHMRAQMKIVMRFAGPRMIIYEPLEFIKHYILHRF